MTAANKVLILDDDAIFTNVLATQLLRLDYHCLTASKGADALQQAKAEQPDILLIDLKLESDSGLRWIKQLRQACPDAQLIMMTAYASIATTVEAIKLGADDYLPKPFSIQQLHAMLTPDNDASDTESAVAITADSISLKRLEWEHIQRTLDAHKGNISAAARELGMHRRTLQRKLQKHPKAE